VKPKVGIVQQSYTVINYRSRQYVRKVLNVKKLGVELMKPIIVGISCAGKLTLGKC